MKTKKKIVGLALALLSVCFNAFSAAAAEETGELPMAAIYDLQKGGTQEFEIMNENGETMYVTVEELDNTNRISNGSYKVSFASPGAWTAGFYVKISDNKITSAYSPFYTEVVGNIQNAYLVQDSSVKASYHFLYKFLLLNSSTGVQAKIENSNLVVTQI